MRDRISYLSCNIFSIYFRLYFNFIDYILIICADGTPATETRKQKIWKEDRMRVVDRLEQLEEEMKQLHEEWAEFDKNREEIELARRAEETKVKKPVTIIKPAKKRFQKQHMIK